jgi:hypothetical protein
MMEPWTNDAISELQAHLDGFGEGSINIFDRDYRYLATGGDGLPRVGLTPEILTGHSLWELFPRPSVQAVHRYYRRAFVGHCVTFTLRVFEREYYISAAPFSRSVDGVESIVAVAVDVTDIGITRFDALVERMRHGIATVSEIAALQSAQTQVNRRSGFPASRRVNKP